MAIEFVRCRRKDDHSNTADIAVTALPHLSGWEPIPDDETAPPSDTARVSETARVEATEQPPAPPEPAPAPEPEPVKKSRRAATEK